MSAVLAFAAVFAIGYFVLLDEDPYRWWMGRLQQWAGWIEGQLGFSQVLAWGVAVGAPALIAGALDLLMRNPYLDFFYNLAVLLLCTGMTSFMRSHAQVVKAVYENNPKQAAASANRWSLRREQVEDSPEQFVPRLLGLCAVRLHEDVLAVLTWYVLLGPLGAVLAAANYVYVHSYPAAQPAFNPIEKAAAAVSTLIFGISGNMGPALAQLPSLRPDRAALAAGNIDPQRISLEQVPHFGRLLERAFLVGSAAAAIGLLVWV